MNLALTFYIVTPPERTTEFKPINKSPNEGGGSLQILKHIRMLLVLLLTAFAATGCKHQSVIERQIGVNLDSPDESLRESFLDFFNRKLKDKNLFPNIDTDRLVSEFLTETSILDSILILDQASEEKRKIYIDLLKTLLRKGYIDQSMINIHHSESEHRRDNLLDENEYFLDEVTSSFEQKKEVSFADKEEELLASGLLPQAKEFLESLRKEDLEKYKEAIELLYYNVFFTKEINQQFSGNNGINNLRLDNAILDCDEKAILQKKLALLTGVEVQEYILKHGYRSKSGLKSKLRYGHTGIKLKKYPLVIDNIDGKVRSLEEFAKNIEYHNENELEPADFLLTSQEQWLTQYNKQREITGYKKTDILHPTSDYSDFLELLLEKAHLEEGIEKKKAIYDFIIQFDSRYVAAYSDYANLLNNRYTEEHDLKKAEEYYKKALYLNPHLIEARYGYTFLLIKLKRYEEAYQQFSMINPPNDNFYFLYIEMRNALRAKGFVGGKE